MSIHTSLDVITLSTNLPRRCGIATFNADVVRQLTAQGARVRTFAMQRSGRKIIYPQTVIGTLEQEKRSAYKRAARRINRLRPDVVLVEHEFGIFGGPDGAYVLDILQELDVPVVTVVHTYPFERVTTKQLHEAVLLQQIAAASDAVIVISAIAQEKFSAELALLGIQTPVIHIPHGAPDVRDFLLEHPKRHILGSDRPLVLTTFGLIGERKGIDDVVEVLPAIIERFPQTVYRILGAPHPADEQAKVYVRRLKRYVRQQGLEQHVQFVTRFLTVPAIMHNLQATDVYITFYHDPNQASSGTLAYALAAGCCIISTPYVHARELLANGRGIIVPFRDSRALQAALLQVIENDQQRQQYRKRAGAYGRATVWRTVGQHYVGVLSAVAKQARLPKPPHAAARRPVPSARRGATTVVPAG